MQYLYKTEFVRTIKERIDDERKNIAELESLDFPADGDEAHLSQNDIVVNEVSSSSAIESAQKRVDKLQRILSRTNDADFGYCSVCGEEIPLERLLVVPETSRCIRHAE